MNRSRTSLSRIAIAALAIASIAVAAAPATGAGGDKAKSKVVIKKLAASGASGKVTSQDGDCKGNRKVSLFRFDDFVSVKIKITYSDGQGNWRVKKDLKNGQYFAKVDASSAGSTTCLYAVSKYKNL